MKAFSFRLERVLQLRSRAERERARALGVAMREEEQRRKRLEEAAARLERCGEQVAGAAEEVTLAGTLHNLGLTVEAAANEVESAEISHRAAEDVLEAEHEKFGEARKERRVVERLREKRHEAWSTEASREEQRELDDVANRRRIQGRGDEEP